MVSAAELSKSLGDHMPLPGQDELRDAVARLRIEVELAQKGVVITEGDVNVEADLSLPPEAVLRGFTSPDDFVVKERTLNYSGGSSYQGEVLGNLRHGKGTYTLATGALYSGDWRYDSLEGRGKAVMPDGQTYDGEWRGGKAQGQGVVRYQNGSVYEGDFENDGRAGWGLQSFPTGDRYEGEWAADKIHGKGRWTCADGSYYEGDWAEGQRVSGRFISADGAVEYNGQWRNDQRQGKGVEWRRGGFKYSGSWVNDEREGRGRCEYADGSVFEGEWRAGMRQGRGTLTRGGAGAAAYRYEGDWAADRQHGEGVCLEDSGDRYVGQFERGLRHGRGRCLYSDGSKYEGEWREGQRWGQGACAYGSGDAYAGEWQRDRRHGYGLCRFADGTKFRGEWEDDAWVQSAADPGRCHVAGAGLKRAVAGKEGQLAILARDEDGNRRLCGGDEFSVVLLLHDEHAAVAGPVAVKGSVVDKGDGTYEATYLATIAGVYQLSITMGPDEHVAESPYMLRVLPSKPSRRWCTVEGEGRSAAAPGCEAHFEVLVHDEFGNRCRGGGLQEQLPLDVSLQDRGAGITAVAVEATRDGRYLCSYTAPAQSGYYRLHLECRGAPLPRTPYSVRVADPAEANAAAAESSDAGEMVAGGSGRAAEASRQVDGRPAPASPAWHDQSRVWERIAEAAYAADGVLDGWDSDEEERRKKQSPEDAYVAAHPGVPVVDNLEDIWLVSKLQKERKAKEERDKAARLGEMQARLEADYGPGQAPDAEAVKAAVLAIVEGERSGQQAPGTPAAEEAAAVRGLSGRETGKEERVVAAGPTRPAARSAQELAAVAAALDELS